MTGPGAVRALLGRLADGVTLERDETQTAVGDLMEGAFTPVQAAAFLTALRVRGETTAEITGGAEALRSRMVRVQAPDGAIDTCGTGGDGLHTLNISTAVALVVAACGVPVAKHGNRAASSRSGAADVLGALGVRLDLGPEAVERCLAEAGIAFLFAPQHHPAMRAVAPVRGELGFRTLFNLLGPLCNPAGVRRQLLGVYSARLVVPLAEVLQALGTERAWVVHGQDGADEISLSGPTTCAELAEGQVRVFTVTPEDAGLVRAPVSALTGGDPPHNAAALRALLDGAASPYRDAVLLNAAGALCIAGVAGDLAAGAARARAALDSGAARDTLARLIAVSNA